MTASHLPSDRALLTRVVDRQSPSARKPFHYALVLLLVEDGKAKIVEHRMVDAQEWVTVRTIAGELFSIVTPDKSDDLLEMLKVLAREIVNAERAHSSPVEDGKPWPFAIEDFGSTCLSRRCSVLASSGLSSWSIITSALSCGMSSSSWASRVQHQPAMAPWRFRLLD